MQSKRTGLWFDRRDNRLRQPRLTCSYRLVTLYRGRNASYPAHTAQIRAGAIHALSVLDHI